jgi:hypothetical protein
MSSGLPSKDRMSTARGLLSSRRRYPFRSSSFRWYETEDVEFRPTASQISRMLGG